MKEFVKLIKYIAENNHNKVLEKLQRQQTPCGLFYCDNNMKADGAAETALKLKRSGINLRCVIVPQTSDNLSKTDDLPFVALNEFGSRNFDVEFILMQTATQFQTMYEIFARQGLKTMLLKNVSVMSMLYDWIMNRLPDIYDAYSLLQDEESGCVFRGFLSANYATANMADYVFASELQYLLPGFLPVPGDIAIDGGAYDGATARDFTELGATVYAFELDADNYTKCLPVAQKFGFTIEKYGLGERRGKVNFSPMGASSRIGEQGSAQGDIIDLDTYVAEHKLPRIDYIKLDIEGAELSALKGAKQSIVKYKPKMAISLYHSPDDLHRIIPYLHSLRPDYEFVCRHYRTDCHNYWLTAEQKKLFRQYNLSLDIATAFELVLYCR